MMINIRTNTPLIILGAVIILAIMLFAVVKIVHIGDIINSIGAEERIYEENKERLEELMLIAKRENEYRNAIERMNRLIPSEAEDYSIIETFNELSEKVNADIIKIEFGDRVVNNNMNVMPLTISTRGTYRSLISLIEHIATCDRLMRIDEISIAQEAGAVSADIEASAFYR